MSLLDAIALATHIGFPRSRGDEPPALVWELGANGFSPLTRG